MKNRENSTSSRSSDTWTARLDQGLQAMERNDFSTAISHFAAAQNDPKCPLRGRQRILSHAVQARLQTQDSLLLEAALNTAQQCVSLDNTWAPAHVTLAEVYIALRRSNDASNSLSRALQLEPHNATARTMLRQQLRHRDANQDASVKEEVSSTAATHTHTQQDTDQTNCVESAPFTNNTSGSDLTRGIFATWGANSTYLVRFLGLVLILSVVSQGFSSRYPSTPTQGGVGPYYDKGGFSSSSYRDYDRTGSSRPYYDPTMETSTTTSTDQDYSRPRRSSRRSSSYGDGSSSSFYDPYDTYGDGTSWSRPRSSSRHRRSSYHNTYGYNSRGNESLGYSLGTMFVIVAVIYYGLRHMGYNVNPMYLLLFVQRFLMTGRGGGRPGGGYHHHHHHHRPYYGHRPRGWF